MTEAELVEMKAMAEGRDGWADCDVAHEAHVIMLVAEVRRLRGLIATAVDDHGCPWCNGDETDGRSFPERRHAADCRAFTPDGQVR